MSDITRIMDLPENVTIQMNTNGDRSSGLNNSYSPMDIHPNPYGHPPPSVPSMPTPTSTGPSQTQMQMPMQGAIPPMQQQLPSRDIPMESVQYMQDEQVQANYIPPVTESAKQTAEYMRQYDELTERKVRAHNEEKEKKSRMDMLYDEGQIPVLVAILFFVFQMPVVTNFLYKNLSFLKMHDLDGHFNMAGLVWQSAMFGGAFYGLTKVVYMLSEL